FLMSSVSLPRALPAFPTRRSSALRASAALGNSEQTSVMLQRAAQSHPKAPLAVALTEAELALGEGRFDAALIALARVRKSARHQDRKSTRLNSSHVKISYAVFCLK